MYWQLINSINSISCFLLTLFVFFLIHKGRKKLSNNLLAAFFIVQFIVILYFLLASIFAGYTRFCIHIAYLYYPFEFLWGPLLYFYIKSQVKQGFRLTYTNFIHLIPFLIVLVFVLSYYSFSDEATKRQIYYSGSMFKWFAVFNVPYYIQLFAYNFSGLYLIINFQRNQQNYCSFVVKRNLIWLKFVLYGYIIACLVTVVINYGGDHFAIPYAVRMLALFTPFIIFFNILFYKAMIEPYVIIMPDEKPKYSGSSLDQSDIQHFAKTIEADLTNQKLYLNPTLTLHDLAGATGISEKAISQAINQQWNQNFFSFINSYRVEEAKRLLNNFDQNKSTMLGVSFDAGFNSKSAFYDAFKKHTGMTPTENRKREV